MKHARVHMDDKSYLDNKIPSDNYHKLLELISFPRFLAVTIEGEIIDRLSGVPGGITKMNINANNVVIKSAHGFYLTNSDFLSCKETNSVNNVVLSAASDLSEKQTEQYARLYRGNDLPMEHVILDLHSGRLLGRWGPIVIDIAAFTLVFLALTGIWLWLIQILRRRRKKLKHHFSN